MGECKDELVSYAKFTMTPWTLSFSVIIPVVCIAGLVGNILSLIVLHRNNTMRLDTVSVLAVIDMVFLFTSLCTSSFVFPSYAGWIPQNIMDIYETLFRKPVLITIPQRISGVVIMLIMAERLYAINRPFSVRRIFTRSFQKKSAIFLSLVSVLAHIPEVVYTPCSPSMRNDNRRFENITIASSDANESNLELVANTASISTSEYYPVTHSVLFYRTYSPNNNSSVKQLTDLTTDSNSSNVRKDSKMRRVTQNNSTDSYSSTTTTSLEGNSSVRWTALNDTLSSSNHESPTKNTEQMDTSTHRLSDRTTFGLLHQTVEMTTAITTTENGHHTVTSNISSQLDSISDVEVSTTSTTLPRTEDTNTHGSTSHYAQISPVSTSRDYLLELNTPINSLVYTIYVVCLTFLFGLIPTVIVIVLNICIVVRLIQTRKARACLSVTQVRESNTTIAMFSVTLVYIFSLLPSYLAFIVAGSGVMDSLGKTVHEGSIVFILFIGCVNASVNIIIYYACGREFRQGLHDILRCRKVKARHLFHSCQ